MSPTSPIVTHVDGFTVSGFSTQTQNSDEFNETTAKFPKLWQKFSASSLASSSDIFSVYSNYESDANGAYTVTVGITSNEKMAECNQVQIETGNYLVFKGKGPMPTTVVETWKQIWHFFEEDGQYERNFISDFESYAGMDEVAIYIGIK